MWFRLTGYIEGFILHDLEVSLIVPRHRSASVRLRRGDIAEPGLVGDGYTTVFDVTSDLEISSDLDTFIGRDARNFAYHSLPIEDVNLQGEVREIRTCLEWSVTIAVTTMEWRFGMVGNHPTVDDRDLAYSREQEQWGHISQPSDPLITGTIPISWMAESSEDAVSLVERGEFEPVAHDLLREAWSLQWTNLRASLILAASAVEVGIRECIARLNPAQAQATRDSRDSVETLLIKELPTALIGDPKFDCLRLSDETIRQLVEAANTRNGMVHRFPGDDRYEQAIARLTAPWLNTYLATVASVLWLFDVYMGYTWARSYLGALPTVMVKSDTETSCG